MSSILSTFLNEGEKELIAKFVANPVQFEAVKKVLLAAVYHNGKMFPGDKHDPSINFALRLVTTEGGERDNAEIGANLKACWEGLSFIQEGFDELKKFKVEDQPVLSPLNEAR